MGKKSANKNRAKNISISQNEQNELVLSGKSRKDKNFEQTLSIPAPCIVFWDDDNDQFVAVPIAAEIPDAYEFVDIITRII